jgi:Spy/CpxP family protein refolding chaperone
MSNALSLRALVLSMAALGMMACSAEAADSKAKSSAEAAKTKKLSGRLPQYYSAVVTEEQRQKIYAIQAEFGPKLTQIRAQLTKLQKEQEEKIEALLTPEQAAKLAKLKAAATEGRKTSTAKSEEGKTEKPEAAGKSTGTKK